MLYLINFKTYEEGLGDKGIKLANYIADVREKLSADIWAAPQFTDLKEISKIVKHLSSMSQPNYIDIEINLQEETEKELTNQEDILFVDAYKIVEETRKASASYLQRRLSIGYNRAAKIIEYMEDMGYIGPQQGNKPREVFI